MTELAPLPRGNFEIHGARIRRLINSVLAAPLEHHAHLQRFFPAGSPPARRMGKDLSITRSKGLARAAAPASEGCTRETIPEL